MIVLSKSRQFEHKLFFPVLNCLQNFIFDVFLFWPRQTKKIVALLIKTKQRGKEMSEFEMIFIFL